MSKIEDFDRRRATSLVMVDATQRILTSAEVRQIHEAILTADDSLRDKRGVALAMLHKANSGRVLTYPEAQAMAQAIEEIWLDKPLSDGVQSGVRDKEVTCHGCNNCAAGGSCPECSACQFNIAGVGGHVQSSLSRPSTYVAAIPKDCGCGK